MTSNTTDTLTKKIQSRFSSHHLTSRVVLPNALLPGPEYLISSHFASANHLPFFYIVGSVLGKADTVFCLDPDYGLELSAFLRGCKANKVLASGKTHFSYPEKNVRQVGYSLEMSKKIPEGLFDVALILGHREWPESRDVLLNIWEKMADNSLIIVDYIQAEPVGRGWKDLEAVKNHPGVIFPTRYGTGLIVRNNGFSKIYENKVNGYYVKSEV
jgi:hypothetical protein